MDISNFDRTVRLAIVSGIPAGSSGTGRFVSHLQERIGGIAGKRIRIICRPEPIARWQIGLWFREKAFRRIAGEALRYFISLLEFWISLGIVWSQRRIVLVLLHPQNLGYRLSLRLVASRAESSLLYLLDSSFFCVASYNHLAGENGSCLRCMERGFEQIGLNGCRPFPRPDWDAVEYVRSLQGLVQEGRIKIAAQNRRQAELAKRHFGLKELPSVIGLWTQDWDESFSNMERNLSGPESPRFSWDVLFHGYCLDAKGAFWVAKVAAQCPELKFMFPFAKPDWFATSDNCSFVPCTWETGLHDEIEKTRFVIVPSLWSAPIEGALVKSIVCARAVIVVDNPTSFCDELPDNLVLKVSADPSVGASELMLGYRNGWRPDRDVKRRWLAAFAKTKVTFVPDLLDNALGKAGESP